MKYLSYLRSIAVHIAQECDVVAEALNDVLVQSAFHKSDGLISVENTKKKNREIYKFYLPTV